MNDDLFEGPIQMKRTCGYCPVQYEGAIAGFPAYFRSRGDHWRFCIAKMGDDPVVTLDPAYYHDEPYGHWPAAGYMPTEEAHQFMRRGVREWMHGLDKEE